MNKHNKSYDELLTDLSELQAYATLEDEPFDFGEGMMVNTTTGESAHYDLMINDIIDAMNNLDTPPITLHKPHSHKRAYRRKDKARYKAKLRSRLPYAFYTYEKSDNHIVVCNRGTRSKFLKRISNGVIRRYKGDIQMKGRNHFKLFDYWWEMD